MYRPTITTTDPPIPPKGGSSADKESRTMTKQEAIEYGLRWKNAICDRGDTELSEAIQFLNMAIQALEQEETLQNLTKPNKSDLISRQAAIDVLEERRRANGYSNVALVSELNRSIGYLMRLPSAQPEQKESEEQ